MDAYSRIESMLSGKDSLGFKKSVFLTENAYYENRLNQEAFDDYIHFCTSICRGIMASGNIIYPENDFERATAQCAVFTFMTDSIPVSTENGIVIHTPFAYNFDDFAGQREWSHIDLNANEAIRNRLYLEPLDKVNTIAELLTDYQTRLALTIAGLLNAKNPDILKEKSPKAYKHFERMHELYR
jgi:hypothetical protein